MYVQYVSMYACRYVYVCMYSTYMLNVCRYICAYETVSVCMYVCLVCFIKELFLFLGLRVDAWRLCHIMRRYELNRLQ